MNHVESPEQDAPHCCKVECRKLAEYEIWHGSKPDEYTHSCMEHIPDLMTDARRHEICTLDGARGEVGIENPEPVRPRSSMEVEWQPIETAPLDKMVLLWWVGGKKLPKAPPTVAMGAISSYEGGHVWDGHNYSPVEWFTHWAPKPSGPSHASDKATGSEK